MAVKKRAKGEWGGGLKSNLCLSEEEEDKGGEEHRQERGEDILDGAEQENEFLSACGEAEAGGQEVQGMGVSWLLSGWWDHRE